MVVHARHGLRFAVAACCLVWGGGAQAQPGTATGGNLQVDLGILAGRPRIQPTRTATPPDIDGRLDDEVWRSAETVTELV